MCSNVQLSAAAKDRQELEGQLHQVRADMMKNQHAARQHESHEVERLEGRVKELLKERWGLQMAMDAGLVKCTASHRYFFDSLSCLSKVKHTRLKAYIHDP